jgi:hypothetical protein
MSCKFYRFNRDVCDPLGPEVMLITEASQPKEAMLLYARLRLVTSIKILKANWLALIFDKVSHSSFVLTHARDPTKSKR